VVGHLRIYRFRNCASFRAPCKSPICFCNNETFITKHVFHQLSPGIFCWNGQWRTQETSDGGASFHNRVMSQINFRGNAEGTTILRGPMACPREKFAKLHLKICIFLHSRSKFWPVVLNVGPTPHRWGMAKFWWGVEDEDIMKNFGGNAKWKGTCSQSNRLLVVKLFYLFTPIGWQSKHVSCALCFPQGKFSYKKCCS